MSAMKRNKANEAASDGLLIAGIQKHLATTAVLVNGTSYASADLVKQVQARLDAVNTTIANRAAWQASVKSEEQELLQTQPFLNALKKAIYTMFSDIDTLADFGLTPHKKAVISPAERVVMAAKAKATRAARHTLGSKQKAAITGSVSSPAVASSPATPPTATAATPPAPPAVATTSGTGASQA
jgi:hypothetical protein